MLIEIIIVFILCIAAVIGAIVVKNAITATNDAVNQTIGNLQNSANNAIGQTIGNLQNATNPVNFLPKLAACPAGFTDNGLYCAKPQPYGRGVGYPIEFPGGPVGAGNAFNKCSNENPQGCEWSGAIAYPKCNDGFHAVGCCVCSPDCPAGWVDIGVSCQKPFL